MVCTACAFDQCTCIKKISRASKLLAKCGYVGDRRPILLEVRSSKWFILSTVTVATFTDIFLYGVIIPVIPFALNERVGVTAEDSQYWVSVLLAVYGASLLGVSPIWGWIADRISARRGPMLCGLIVLAAATALLAVGTSLPVLITGRALQGASGAIVWISGLALMVDTVGQKDVGQMMGYVGASLSLAFLIGPALGGVVAERAGYEGVFAMCWACIGLDIVLRLVMIEKKVAIKWLGLEGAYGTRVVTALPPPTAVEAAANDPKAVVAVPTTPSLPTTAAAVVPASGEVVTFPKSTVSGLASEPNTNHRSVSCPIVPTGASDINPSPKPFRSPSDSTLLSKKDLEKAYDSDTSRSSRTEIALPHHSNGIKFPTTLPRTNSAHVLPPKHITIDPDLYNIPRRPLSQRIPLFTLLKSPRLLASLFAVMIQSALLTSLDSTVPLRVRDIFHWGSLGAGLVFLALTLPTFLGPLVGWWVDHHGPRLPGALSYVLGVPFFVLLRLIQDDTTSAKVGFCALLAGIGLSIGLAISPIMVEISNVVVDMERKRPGIFGEKGAMAQAYALFNLFFAAGSLIGPVWGGMIEDHAGWSTETWTLGLLSAVTAVPVFLFMGGPIWSPDAQARRWYDR